MYKRQERNFKKNSSLSFGYGSEYKYDWGNYKTLTFTSQTKGHLKNLGTFANSGYRFNDNQSLSLHVRNDDHKETGGNQTYKINFTQLFDNLKIGLTRSTGLKNPSLYELYGSSSSHSGSTIIDPEKSSTNELYGEYIFSEKFGFNDYFLLVGEGRPYKNLDLVPKALSIYTGNSILAICGRIPDGEKMRIQEIANEVGVGSRLRLSLIHI